jgi:hypothetical protein
LAGCGVLPNLSSIQGNQRLGGSHLHSDIKEGV